MDTQQIADYLEKYNLKTKEQLASHIEQLKRNTKPNLALISELVWVLEDDSSFFNFYFAQNRNKWFTNDDFIEITLKNPDSVNNIYQELKKCSGQCFCDGSCKKPQKNLGGYDRPKVKQKYNFEQFNSVVGDLEGINKPPQKSLNNHISKVINDEQQERRSAEHIDEVLDLMDFNEKGTSFGEEIDFSNILSQWIDKMTGEIPAKENKGMSTRHKAHSEKEFIDNWEKHEDVNQNNEGVKLNELKPQLSLLFKQFPKALEAISRCSEYGHEKYKETDSDYLNFKRVKEGSKAYADAGLRHRLEKEIDLESMLPHCYHVAWNALAELELILENK